METFHRFFWTFNGALAVIFGIRAGFLLFFNQTEDQKLWLFILIFCIVFSMISARGYHMYVGFKFLSKNNQDK